MEGGEEWCDESKEAGAVNVVNEMVKSEYWCGI